MADRMTYRAQAGAVLALGLPLVGSNLAQYLLNVTDTVMLGWYSVRALAAVTLGSSSFFIVLIVGAGFAKAVMPMVAEAASSDDRTEARRVTRMGLWLSILYAVAAMPLMWYSGPLLRLLGQKPEIAQLTQDYLRIAGWSLLPGLLVMVLRSFLAALERTRVVLLATLAGVALNAVLDWLLIFGHGGLPELGVQGAAIATLGTHLLTLAIAALYAALQPELRPYQLFTRFWRADWPAFGQVFRLGWPMGLTSLAEGGLFQASALMMGWIGTVQLAAHGIALEIVALTFMVHLGLSNAATIRGGRARGRGDARGLRDGAAVAVGLSALFALVAVATIVAFPHQLLGLFINPDDPLKPQLLDYGTRFVLVAALFQFADATQVMALGLLAALKDTRGPMVQAAVSYWLIGIPASYALAFPLGLGGVGLWLGLTLGLTLAAVLMMTRFWRKAPRVEV
ncbi:MATE family efflux transporter [Acidimangrovimonas pyrenivorans]|uniref:Multidrug-efflux transporter n=1 Tax=Acidimangrovimonas pyrenivorans TaxID=2030798 RepID=A0ABV7ABU2_9RHOB